MFSAVQPLSTLSLPSAPADVPLSGSMLEQQLVNETRFAEHHLCVGCKAISFVNRIFCFGSFHARRTQKLQMSLEMAVRVRCHRAELYVLREAALVFASITKRKCCRTRSSSMSTFRAACWKATLTSEEDNTVSKVIQLPTLSRTEITS